jgi:hypothetical protein
MYTIDVQCKIIFKGSCQKKREIFIDICQNCWKPKLWTYENLFMVYYHYNLEQLMNKTTWITHINLKAIVLKDTNNFQSIIKFLGVMFNLTSFHSFFMFHSSPKKWDILHETFVKSGLTCTVHEFYTALFRWVDCLNITKHHVFTTKRLLSRHSTREEPTHFLVTLG